MGARVIHVNLRGHVEVFVKFFVYDLWNDALWRNKNSNGITKRLENIYVPWYHLETFTLFVLDNVYTHWWIQMGRGVATTVTPGDPTPFEFLKM